MTHEPAPIGWHWEGEVLRPGAGTATPTTIPVKIEFAVNPGSYEDWLSSMYGNNDAEDLADLVREALSHTVHATATVDGAVVDLQDVATVEDDWDDDDRDEGDTDWDREVHPVGAYGT